MSRARTTNYNVRSPFELTATEEAALKMFRAGMKHKEVMAALGRVVGKKGGGVAIGVIVEKDRLRKLYDDRRGNNRPASLSKARGAVRMEGTK